MHSWPLFDLVLRTPRLVLRLPSDAELDVLARRAAGRVLPPEQMDFMDTGWTQLPSPAFERSFLQFHWQQRAAWSENAWSLQLVAFADDEPIGGFGLLAKAFTERRRVDTGSWLLPDRRRDGLGQESRSAMLELAFSGLGAHVACSHANELNGASLGVSRALGYEETGSEAATGPSGEPIRHVFVELTREAWERRERIPVEVVGLDACRELFG